MQKLNNQQAFDKALFGIRAQNYVRSVIEKEAGMCAYRGDNGIKCAVGHCIPDELYDPVLDRSDSPYGNGWRMLTGTLPNHPAVWFLSDCDVKLLNELQQCHDSMVFRTNFERDMRTIAEEHNLVYTPVSE